MTEGRDRPPAADAGPADPGQKGKSMTYWCRIRNCDNKECILRLEHHNIRELYYAAFLSARDIITSNMNVHRVSFKIYSDDRNYRRMYVSGPAHERDISFGIAYSHLV